MLIKEYRICMPITVEEVRYFTLMISTCCIAFVEQIY